ncbi:BACON domain-containing protein [Thalassobellus citreus]|uniref:BACON domain-containing protein n=1 Tax=Thalassobellus citreus TaxID=3367752 RepID=UPI0037BB5BDF
MAFNPTANTFPYKKYSQSPVPTGFVRFSQVSLANYNTRNYQVLNLPNWLVLKNLALNPDTKDLEFQLDVNETVAESLSEGSYTAKLSVQYDVYVSGWGTYHSAVYGYYYTATLTVEDTVLLTISPTTLPFGNYLIGDPLPQNKTLQIQTETNWNLTANQTWVTFASPKTGVGNSSVYVGVDPTGLTPGYYEAIITVQDSVSPLRTALVSLTVTEGDTETDFLYVTPRNFEFVSEFEVENLKELPIIIESSGNWVATKENYWPVISAESGGAGITNATISVDSEALDVGELTAPITFTMGDIVKKIYVTVKIITFYTKGVESYGLYYADDRNTLEVTSTADNNWLLLDMVTANGIDNLPYTQEEPYHKGVAKTIIGLETNSLMPLVPPPTLFNTRIQNNITPINIGFTAFNINKFTEAVAQIEQFQNLFFLKGKTPAIENKLCYIPSAITVTNKAILSLSSRFLPSTEINITGDASYTFETSISGSLMVYNAIVNLSTLNLKAGDNIKISWGTIEVDVTIIANTPEENLLAFENEWGDFELFPTTGFLTKTPTIKDVTTQIAVDGKELTKVVSIDYGVEYTLNTGFVRSQEEVDWLVYILKAKRKFIYFDGEPVEIYFTTKKLEVYETRRHTHSFNLKFKRALV